MEDDSKNSLNRHSSVNQMETGVIESILHSGEDVAFILDKQGCFIHFNDRLETVLGYLPEETIGQPFTRFLPAEEIPRYLVQLRRVFIRKHFFHFTTRIVHKKGYLVDAEINGHLIRYQGELAGQGTLRDVTDKKRMEQALNESLNSYKGLFDTVTEAIYVHKDDGVFIDVNIGATQMYGYSREELIGRSPELVSAPGRNDLSEVAAMMKRVLQTGKPEKFEFWGRRKNGEIFPKDVICNRGKYFGEEVLISTARDITERKTAEQALRESEARYRILAEKMHDVVWIIDMDLRVVYVSPSTLHTLGFTPEERMAMRIDECMVPESLDYAMQVLINEAVASQERGADKDRGVLLELEYYHKDGTTRWLEQSINGIYDENGELTALMGVARDITERRKAQEALQASAASYRGLFNSVTDAIYVLDKEGKFIDVNEGAVKMYGYPHDVLVGKDPSFVSADGMNDIGQVACMLERAYNGEKQQFEFWGKRADGDVFLKDVRLYNGIYFGQKVIVAMAHDITRRKQQELELVRQVEELKALVEAVQEDERTIRALKSEINGFLAEQGKPPRYSV